MESTQSRLIFVNIAPVFATKHDVVNTGGGVVQL